MGRGRKGTGVEAREASIRVRFTWQGERCAETLALRPTGPNLKYAQRLVAEIHRQIALGNFQYADFFPDSPRAIATKKAERTFGQVADLWLRSKGQLAAASLHQYGNSVAFWKRTLGEHKAISSFDHQELAAIVGSHEWKSAKSCNNYLIVLRGIFGFEYHGPRAVDDPTSSITNMTAVKKLPDPLSPEERDAVLVDLRGHYDVRVWAYFLFAFATGMRPEEIIALQWADIDWNHKSARIRRVRTFGGLDEREGDKIYAERDVDLVAGAIDALDAMKAYTFMKGGDIFEDPVLGAPWEDEKQQREKYFYPALKRLGIRQRRAYVTRSTYASAALMAGIPPAYIAAQLGHKNAKMLFDKYARWINGADKGAARRMLEVAFAGVVMDKDAKNG